MFTLFVRRVWRCTGALLLVHSALASQPDTQLTLQDAIDRSLGHNLDLKAFGYELQAQQGRVQQAGARAPLEVHALTENILGGSQHSGLDDAETTLSFVWTLERGARERRAAAAQAGSMLLDTDARIRRLDVAAETARRFLSVLAAQQETAQLQHATGLAQETLKAVEQRVRAAKAPQAEEARARAQLARARLDQEHAEHGLASARQRLAAMWGMTDPDFARAEGDVMAVPALEPFNVLRTRLQNSSGLERLISEKRLREAQVRVAEIHRRPPWQVTTGVRRFEDDSDYAFVVGVTVPLPVRARASGAVTEARAQSAQIDAETAALRVRLDAELFGLYQELRHAYTAVTALRDSVLPLTESAAEQSRYAYERGRYGYAEWIAAQRELSELRRALLQASVDVHRHRIEIERLTGTALSGRLIQ